LPIGVQIAAKPWREDVALAIAHHLEEASGVWPEPQI
jgi:amidase